MHYKLLLLNILHWSFFSIEFVEWLRGCLEWWNETWDCVMLHRPLKWAKPKHSNHSHTRDVLLVCENEECIRAFMHIKLWSRFVNEWTRENGASEFIISDVPNIPKKTQQTDLWRTRKKCLGGCLSNLQQNCWHQQAEYYRLARNLHARAPACLQQKHKIFNIHRRVRTKSNPLGQVVCIYILVK